MSQLTITNSTIRYGSQFFQLSNVTQVKVQAWKEEPALSIKAMFIFLAIGTALWFLPHNILDGIYGMFADKPLGFGKFSDYLAGLISFGFVGVGIWDRTQLNYYTLLIETSSGSSRLFSSRDWKGINAVSNMIYKMMENRHTAASYVVNVDQSKITIGDQISNSGAGATVINRSNIPG